jgi:hypothetical protein
MFYRAFAQQWQGVHIQTRPDGNSATEMGSGAMIYIPSFIMIGSSIQKLIGRIHRDTDFFQNKESRLINNNSNYYYYYCCKLITVTARSNARNVSTYRTLRSWVRFPLRSWMFVLVSSVFVLFYVDRGRMVRRVLPNVQNIRTFRN